MDNLSYILFAGFFLVFIIQLIYYLVYYAKPFRYQKQVDKKNITFPENAPPVSVIICATNESQNLFEFLPSVLNQDYPDFEVIVVNDGSTDETDEVLSQFEREYTNLYHTYVPAHTKNLSRKKLAITIGIKAAKNDVLLFTEANCKPVSSDWIRKMARHFNSNQNLVIGFSTFSKSYNIFSKYAVYDNLLCSLRYLSLALFNKPYMGVGRNLAYKKDLFYKHKGFCKHLNLRVGEDDLFVNEILEEDKTTVEISPDSITITYLDNLSIWKELKVSNAATQRYFKFGPITLWRFEAFSRLLFYSLFIFILIFTFPNWILMAIASTIFILRLIIQLIVINKTARKYQIERFYFTLLLFDVLQPFINIYYFICRIFRGKKDYTWR